MKIKTFFLLTFLLSIPLFCQTSRWRDHFSYFNIYDVIEAPDKFICSSENGLFTYNKTSGEIVKISKANGLNGVRIASIAYNTTYDYIFVSYQNGALNIVKPDGLEYFVDIPIDTDFNGDKAINHIYTEGDNAVFSMDFGVIVFNIPRLEVDETTYFRNGTNYIKVNEAVILNNTVYGGSDVGIYSHPIDNAIAFFPSWAEYLAGNAFQQMETFNSTIFAGSNGSVFKYLDGNSWTNFASFLNLKDINSSATHISFISTQNIQTYNQSLTPISNKTFTEDLNTGIYSNSITYGGSILSGLINQSSGEKIVPDGPYKNISYHISLLDDKIWIAPGGRDNYYILPQFNRDGYFYFNGLSWEHIKYENLNNFCCIMDIIPNPNIPEEAFAISYSSGAIKIKNNIFDTQYSSSNSSIINSPWCVGGQFDDKGNLIFTQTFLNVNSNGVNFKTPDNQWKLIDFVNVLNGNISTAAAVGYPAIDDKNWVWVPSQRGDGLVVYDYNNTPLNTSDDKSYVITQTDGKGKLPSNQVVCVDIDKNQDAWIGCTEGIRVLRNPHSVLLEDSYNTDLIVIIQNNIPEELLKDVEVTVIKTDEANRKWVGTKNNGVFYISPNGETIYNTFTASNSPLPSNQINDIEIDTKTGWVYFATLYGVISYKSDITKAGDKFNNILPYPNPVRPGYYGTIVIKGLANNANVKITDVNGNLVNKGTAVAGIYEWDQKNLRGNLVTSGIYFVLMTNLDNSESATTKIAIVR